MAVNQSKFVNVVVILGLIGLTGVFISLGHIVSVLVGEWQQAAIRAGAAPYSNANSTVTSKDTNQHLSIKSAALPKGGDVTLVDQYVYGATSVGDSVCVQYRSTPSDRQYDVGFVGQGSCQK
jgi:hypothetical protein